MASICYVGDSRTNGLKNAIGSGASFIAKDSQGLSWLKSTAYSQVKNWLKSNPSGVVIFNFGVNDLYNISNYISYYKNTVIAENSGKSIYFMTVNPTDGSHSGLISDIKSFNSKMASNFPNRIIDTYSNVSFTTTDGLHYNTSTYKAIHQYVQKVLGSGATQNSTSLRTKLLQIAQAEVGTKETGSNECKYNDWYYGHHVAGSAYPWCAVFVSWCANQAGMLNTFIPKTASCSEGMSWYSKKGWYKQKGSYTPQAGDIIYFGGGSHTGIVKSCDGSTVHTIEGNSSNSVKENSYSVGSSYISGYGAYEGAGVAGAISSSGSDGTSSSSLESLMPATTYTTYTVKKGDTLESIAKKYNTTVAMIIYLNDLDVNDLSNLVGKKLTVPENSNSESVGSIASSQVITKKSTRGVTLTHPYAKVSIFTETGMLSITQSLIVKDTTMDLDILSIATSRDLEQDCPTFNITLCFRREWYEKIASNDLIVIEMCRPPETKRSVFFGLIDDSRKSTDYNSDTPTRTISITGRGFGKAFSRFEIGVISELSAVNDTLGFMSNSLDALANGSPAELTRSVIDFYIGKGCNYKFSNGKSYMDYYQQTITGRDDDYEQLADTSTFLSYQGTLNNFLKELRNAPFNEFFWEVYNNRPTFIFRPTPFNEPEWTSLHRIEIKDMDVVKESLGKSDVETYTVYKVNAETFLGTTDTIYFPLWYPPYYEKYGLARLEVTSKYLTAGNALDASSGIATNGTVTSGGTVTSDGTLEGNTKAVYEFLINNGYSSVAAAAACGNLMWESGGGSSGIKLNAVESTGEGVGMVQWSFGRKTAFINYCKSKGETWPNQNVQLQCEFMLKELNEGQWSFAGTSFGYPSSMNVPLSTFKTSTNIDAATGYWCACFERCYYKDAHLSTRIQYAKQVLQKYGSSSASTRTSAKAAARTVANSKFKTYNLSDSELKGIARLCQQEQGSVIGASAEASLMANRFELHGAPYSSLYSYVKNSGWFAKASYWMSQTGSLQNSILNAVKSVLVEGRRTLPAYVDEHDCFSDISKATNDGTPISVTNRSAYVKNKTIIKNNYGSTYTFYCFPDSNSDPFGYTSESKRQELGEDYYGNSSGDIVSGGASSSYTSAAMENEREATLARMADLFNWNILNNAMENGTVVVKGSNQYRVGERVIFESTGIEYYVEAVAHNFTFFQGWTTTLTLTRGIVPNLRYAPPWGKYQEMTMEDASKIFGYDVGSCMVATSSGSSSSGNYSGQTGTASTSGWGSNGVSCPRYYQSGQSWSNIDYQGGSIARRGCGLCCLAMAVSGLLKINATPDQVVKLLNSAGVNTVYNAQKCTEIVCNHYGLKWTTVNRSNKSAIDAYLKKGCVIYHSINANGIYTGDGHFILCVGTNGNGGYYVQESAHYYQSDKAYTFNQVFSAGNQGPFVIGTSL